MLKNDDIVTIGNKYSVKMSYDVVAGHEGIIKDTTLRLCKEHHYNVDGFLIKVALTSPTSGLENIWEIHIEDCIPIVINNNSEGTRLLHNGY